MYPGITKINILSMSLIIICDNENMQLDILFMTVGYHEWFHIYRLLLIYM